MYKYSFDSINEYFRLKNGTKMSITGQWIVSTFFKPPSSSTEECLNDSTSQFYILHFSKCLYVLSTLVPVKFPKNNS